MVTVYKKQLRLLSHRCSSKYGVTKKYPSHTSARYCRGILETAVGVGNFGTRTHGVRDDTSHDLASRRRRYGAESRVPRVPIARGRRDRSRDRRSYRPTEERRVSAARATITTTRMNNDLGVTSPNTRRGLIT